MSTLSTLSTVACEGRLIFVNFVAQPAEEGACFFGLAWVHFRVHFWACFFGPAFWHAFGHAFLGIFGQHFWACFFGPAFLGFWACFFGLEGACFFGPVWPIFRVHFREHFRQRGLRHFPSAFRRNRTSSPIKQKTVFQDMHSQGRGTCYRTMTHPVQS